MRERLGKMRSSIAVTYITLLIITAIAVGVFNITQFNSQVWLIFSKYGVANNEHHDLLKEIFYLNATLGFLGSFFYVVFGFLGSLQLTKSAKRIIKTIDSFQLGSISKIERIETGDEFEVISETFGTLVDRLNETTFSKNHLESILNSMEDTILILAESGEIKWCNYSATGLTGYEVDILRSADIAILIRKESDEAFIYEEYIEMSPKEFLKSKIDLNKVKTFLSKRTGERIPVLLSSTSLRSHGKREIVIVLHNMSQVVTEEREKREIQAQLMATAKMASLGEMGSGIAHELNNPLTVINGFASLVEENMKKGDVSRDLLELGIKQITKNVNRMADIIKNLRTFSSSSEGETFKNVNLTDIYASVLGLCEQRFMSHSINLEVLPYDPSITIFGSKTQVAQMLVSLLSNSYDAIRGFDEKWIRIETLSDASHTIIKVRDSGKRPSKEVCQKMFNPFFTTKITSESSGIGLSVTQRMISDHGGDIKIDEKEEHTTFVLRFPKERR